MNQTLIAAVIRRALHDEPLDSVLYRAIGSSNGIEALMMSDAKLVESLHLNAGQAVAIPAAVTAQKKTNTTLINLWD